MFPWGRRLNGSGQTYRRREASNSPPLAVYKRMWSRGTGTWPINNKCTWLVIRQ